MSAKSIIDRRRDQLFPVLELAEIERIRRFGHTHSYGPGETVVKAGEKGHGLVVVLSGQVNVIRHDFLDSHTPICRPWRRRVSRRACTTGGPAGAC